MESGDWLELREFVGRVCSLCSCWNVTFRSYIPRSGLRQYRSQGRTELELELKDLLYPMRFRCVQIFESLFESSEPGYSLYMVS